MAKPQHEKLAFRLTNILARLNSGERLNIRDLTDEFGVCERTISRDFSRLKPLLKWTEEKYPYYQLDRRSLGILTQEDIERFARFACISKLFPKIDRSFYAEKLLQEVQIKGFRARPSWGLCPASKVRSKIGALFYSAIKRMAKTTLSFTKSPPMLC